MTRVDSPDKVFKEFFRIKDWDFIRHVYHAVLEEESVDFENKSIVFEEEMVCVYIDERMSKLHRHECMKIFLHLFDLMIVGANDDHHGIRYEPWWQEFTEATYQLRRKVEVYNDL
jgi:hypothetical protein